MILVTGAAGFIGFHVALRLLNDGQAVHGVDSLNDYYDVKLKEARLALLRKHPRFTFTRIDLANAQAAAGVFASCKPDQVINLAAQAGVRYSLDNPRAYVDSNVAAFLSVLEGCRRHQVKHLVFASSSSVYGLDTAMPFSVHQGANHPASLYAATKRAGELMAHSYSHLFGLPATGLRLFTVYGPWGRPDMALFHFTRRILAGEPIDVYGEGRMQRDFTYIDDVVEGVVRLLARPPAPGAGWNGAAPDPATSTAPFRLYNVGNHAPVELARFIEAIEACLGRKAVKRMLPRHPEEVPATFADISDIARDAGFAPSTSLETGIRRFVEWYRAYYGASTSRAGVGGP